MRSLRTVTAAALAAAVTGSVASPGAAVAAPPPGACDNPSPASPVVRELPWAQRTLGAQAVRRQATGSGVVVAVVDSGVDSDHPQLREPGKVLRGQDFFLVGDLPGSFDCVSHGTAVASIIAARPAEGIGFAGLAPDATILPVRVSERDATGEGTAQAIDPEVLARGIWYAADHGADVINLSVAGSLDNRFVRDAVRHAQSEDVVVVAAVGNAQEGTAPGPATYPAGYDGVLGVGAVDPTGTRLPSSQIGPQVDIVAPGGGVLAAARAGGHRYHEGTSFAAPFVAATAALVRSARPELSAEQVVQRILATATPAPGGLDSQAYGAGLVDPYRAVTDGLVGAPPSPPPPVERPATDPAQARASAWWDGSTSASRVAAVVTLAAAVLGAAVAFVLLRGRRSRWQPRRAVLPARGPVRDELPDELFVVPPPPADRL
ncbi:type VII secretion-associated serine protease mycosin [Prauserella shujinwangii]|uniref:Type VII secretion-associated serine protease mycosin n=1 Tax=Prauserella shujinwangii TaxID=1453103 RepID=A0A2T0LTE9_9PSEU|nr:type VII secretion-associated serine protease mycosin [Prauserella shujinwangii]PRX47018.1 type VII secretion-associated serine protease mycosin [Prauserella shujinwangii]